MVVEVGGAPKIRVQFPATQNGPGDMQASQLRKNLVSRR